MSMAQCAYGTRNCPQFLCVYCERDALRAEVERLTRERDEAHAVLADAAAALEAKDMERLRLDLCDRYARTRAYALNEERKARVEALETAARTYRYSEVQYGGGLRPEFAPKVRESGAALDALLAPAEPVEARSPSEDVPTISDGQTHDDGEPDTRIRSLLRKLQTEQAPAKPCAKCGGSEQVGVMRVEIVADENGEPVGEWVGDSEPCPKCRKDGAQ